MRPNSHVEDFSAKYLGYWTDAGFVFFVILYSLYKYIL